VIAMGRTFIIMPVCLRDVSSVLPSVHRTARACPIAEHVPGIEFDVLFFFFNKYCGISEK